MGFNVLRQVVAPHEALGTFWADKLLLSCQRRRQEAVSDTEFDAEYIWRGLSMSSITRSN